MPTLHFKGKTFVQNHHLAVKYHQLVPKKDLSLTDKVSLHDNLIIQGDNLKALKALLPSYAGKIKCIYIDPPYNTGNEKWVYNDNVNSPMLKEWLGQIVDKEDLTRHDKWLCMMTPRLKLLRELLSVEGAIFVSIDDNELHTLRVLMDEIFTEFNFRNTLIIRRGVKSVQAQFKTIDRLNYGAEYVVCYTKNPEFKFQHLETELEEEKLGSWNNHWRGTDRPTMRYKLFGIKPETGQWRWSEERSLKAVENYKMMVKEIGEKEDENSQDEIDRWYSKYVEENDEELDLLRLSNNSKPEHYIPSSDTKLVSSLWADLKPNGNSQLKQVFGKKTFDTPKSVDLIKRIIKFICADDKNSIILDSFAGSGTTAHAVLELNKEDGGNRKFILVEQEDYANTITAERVRRVIKGVKTAKNEKLKKGTGGTFSYFQLGETIEMESLLKGKNLPSFKEFARYLFYTATGEEFNEKSISEKTGFIGESKNYEAYLFYKPDLEWLKKNALTLELCKSLPKHKDKKRLVFAPAKYVDDITLLEHRIDFCQLPYEIYRIQK